MWSFLRNIVYVLFVYLSERFKIKVGIFSLNSKVLDLFYLYIYAQLQLKFKKYVTITLMIHHLIMKKKFKRNLATNLQAK
jgi:hypothetical protein